MSLEQVSRPFWQRLLIYIVLSVLIIAIFIPSLFLKWNRVLFSAIFFSFLMCLLIPEGITLINNYLDKRLPWKGGLKKRYYINLGVIVGYCMILSISISILFAIFFWGVSLKQLSFSNLYSSLLITCLVTIIISLFVFSVNFLNKWEELASELEQRKNKALYAQIETLQNQIKPHFLFNNLNAVTSIIPKEPDMAIQFIHQLANVYRYILDHQNEEIVPLKTEIDFAESYYFLLKIRFGKKIHLHWDVDNTKGSVPPYVLQLLLENAVKHNIISKHKPLHITIQRQDNTIVVSNNLQVKPAEGVSWGIGLNNIKERYALFSDKVIQITQTPEQFKVALPILVTTKQ